jgi:hypothetical protein
MFKHQFSARMALLGFLGIALFVPQEITWATEFTATGNVVAARAYDSTLGVDTGYVTITGFSSAGSCPVNINNRVMMRVRGDSAGNRLFAVALTGQALGRTVTLRIDDAIKDPGGTCFLQYIEMN